MSILNQTKPMGIWLLAISCFLHPSYLLAQNNMMPLWKEVEGWDVRVDQTLGNGCFAMAIYDGGIAFRIGINPTTPNWGGYMIFGNQDWSSLEMGKDYSLKYTFDNENPWIGNARGFKFSEDDSMVFLMQTIDKPEVFKEYMRKNTLKIEYLGEEIAFMKLEGSYAAFLEIMKCQAAMNENSTQKKDPFASSSSFNRNRDPFAAN